MGVDAFPNPEAFGSGSGSAWRDGQYLGEVVSIDAELEVPAFTVGEFGGVYSMRREPYRWWDLRRWWHRWRPPPPWRDADRTRSGTFRVAAVDVKWERRVLNWLNPGWRFSKMHVFCALAGRVVAVWLLWRAWRERGCL